MMVHSETVLKEFFGCELIEKSNLLKTSYKFENTSGEKLTVIVDLEKNTIGTVVEFEGGETFFEVGADEIKIIRSDSRKIMGAFNAGGIVFFSFYPKFDWRMVNKEFARYIRSIKRTAYYNNAIKEMREPKGQDMEQIMASLTILDLSEEELLEYE